MQATKHLNIHGIKVSLLCSFALSCSGTFARESSDQSQRAAIIAINTQIGDYYCEHKYDRAAKAFEQVLPLLEKLPDFSESYMASSYLNYSSVLSRLHKTDASNKYAAKARELEAKAKSNDLEKTKLKPSFGLQPSPSPLPARVGTTDVLVPPAIPAPHAAPTDSEAAPYVADLQRRIRRASFPPAASEGKIAVIEFFVHSNGTVSDIKIDKSAGSVDYDRAMRKSIEDAAPFRKMDYECPIQFRCTFTGSKQGAAQIYIALSH
jgi:TonB family protein